MKVIIKIKNEFNVFCCYNRLGHDKKNKMINFDGFKFSGMDEWRKWREKIADNN